MDVRLLWISCTFLLLHRLAIRHVPYLHLCTCLEFSRSKVWKCDFGTLLITRGCNRWKVPDIDNNLTSTHFPRRDFLCLTHPQSHSSKVETMHLLRIFKIKSLNMRKSTLRLTRRCNGRKVQDIDNNLTSTHFPRRDFLRLRHPQSRCRKVKTMHLLTIFKIKSWKCNYGTLLITRRCNKRKVQDIDNNLTFTHFPRRDFFMLETPAKSF